ncbi:MAG: hypothetical protein LBL05_00015 [Synergistaceae bacterium]|jgi:hypothetical protein|nr:hypothetical protein [Synergistaceae bacterium]
MNNYLFFAILAIAAILVVFVVLRIIVYFVSSIPKWLYVLLILCAIFGAAFVAFGSAVTRTFGF